MRNFSTLRAGRFESQLSGFEWDAKLDNEVSALAWQVTGHVRTVRRVPTPPGGRQHLEGKRAASSIPSWLLAFRWTRFLYWTAEPHSLRAVQFKMEPSRDYQDMQQHCRCDDNKWCNEHCLPR